MTRVLLSPARPVIDDTYLEPPMPDARFDREYLPLDYDPDEDDDTDLTPVHIALYAMAAICIWALVVWAVLRWVL